MKVPYVDVQHPDPDMGEFTRYFATDEEADRYVIHMKRNRGYFAEKRRNVTGRILTERKQYIPAMCLECPHYPDNREGK